MITRLRPRGPRASERKVLPWAGAGFVACTGLLAGAFAAVAVVASPPTRETVTIFVVLAGLAAVTDLFTVRGARYTVYDTAAVFLVAAAILLPVGSAAFAALPACLVDGWRRRPSRAALLHNIFMSALATMAASAIVHGGLAEDGPQLLRVVVLFAAVVAYALTTTGLDGLYGHFVHGLRLPAVSPSEVGAEFVLAAMGVAFASFWTFDPWVIPFLLAPLVFIHRSQRLPALEEEAGTDSKTGLLNMRRFEQQLDGLLARTSATDGTLSLLVADLDLLREINNAHGHLASDAVIFQVSELVRAQIRQKDIAARFGGEEFLVALPETSVDDALRIAERIRETVASRLFCGENPRFRTRATLSVGVASFPRDASDSTSLIHAADLAVLAAKARGRDCVVDASELPVVPPPTAQAPGTTSGEAALLHAEA